MSELSSSDIQRLIHLAKLAESVERYDDMVVYMRKVATCPNHRMSTEERNLLSVAFKNVVASKRSGWRLSSSFEMKDRESGDDILAQADKEYKEKMEHELKKDCTEVLDLIKSYLDHQDDIEETKIFYLKMQGDYIRYMVEVCEDEKKPELKVQAEELYEKASKIAKCLSPCNPVRLGLALNYSVFHYEIQENASKAREIAQEAFAMAAPELEELKDPEYKDSALILQLLRDNLSLWTEDDDMPVQQLDD